MSTLSNKTFVFNGTVIAEAPLATCGPELAKSKGKTDPTPIPTLTNEQGRFMYMPGAGLRSALRGCATNIVREALVARNLPLLSLKDAQLLRVGGVKQAGAEAAMNVAEYREMVRKNPVIGLFGASTPWVTGKACVGHSICTHPNDSDFGPMVVDGVRKDIIRTDPDVIEFLTPDAMGEYQAAIEKVKAYSKVKTRITELEREVMKCKDAAAKKELREQLDKLKKSSKEDSTVSAQMPLTGYCAIPVGAKLSNKIRLLNASSIELGCLLAAMQRFAMRPILGAHAAHGAGEVSANWTVAIAGAGEIGSIKMTPYVGLEISDSAAGNVLSQALADFNTFIESGDLEPWATAALAEGGGEAGDE